MSTTTNRKQIEIGIEMYLVGLHNYLATNESTSTTHGIDSRLAFKERHFKKKQQGNRDAQTCQFTDDVKQGNQRVKRPY